MLCCVCNEKESKIKGKCTSCYKDGWRKDNPEKTKDYTKKYYETHKDVIKARNKQWRKNNREKYNENNKKHSKKWRKAHPPTDEQKKKFSENIHRFHVCKILKKHAEDLRDDPERLSTDFIKKMSSIKFRCDT